MIRGPVPSTPQLRGRTFHRLADAPTDPRCSSCPSSASKTPTRPARATRSTPSEPNSAPAAHCCTGTRRPSRHRGRVPALLALARPSLGPHRPDPRRPMSCSRRFSTTPARSASTPRRWTPTPAPTSATSPGHSPTPRSSMPRSSKPRSHCATPHRDASELLFRWRRRTRIDLVYRVCRNLTRTAKRSPDLRFRASANGP